MSCGNSLKVVRKIERGEPFVDTFSQMHNKSGGAEIVLSLHEYKALVSTSNLTKLMSIIPLLESEASVQTYADVKITDTRPFVEGLVIDTDEHRNIILLELSELITGEHVSYPGKRYRGKFARHFVPHILLESNRIYAGQTLLIQQWRHPNQWTRPVPQFDTFGWSNRDTFKLPDSGSLKMIDKDTGRDLRLIARTLLSGGLIDEDS